MEVPVGKVFSDNVQMVLYRNRGKKSIQSLKRIQKNAALQPLPHTFCKTINLSYVHVHVQCMKTLFRIQMATFLSA